MRKCLSIVSAGLWLVGGMASANAGEGSIGVDVSSAYVWRGITVNKDMVAQPSLESTIVSGLVASVWANYDIGDNDGAYRENEFSEVDLGVAYTREVGPVELTAGYTEYLYPQQMDGTNMLNGSREVSLKAGYELVDNLSLAVGLYYDVDEVEDFYASAAVAYGIELVPDALSGEVGALVGYVGKDWAVANGGGTDGGWNEYTLSFALYYAASEAVEVGAHMAFSDTLDKDVLPEQDVDWFGGVAVSYGF